MASAGRILIMPKGEWNANTQYEMLDLVSWGGTVWLAKAPSNNTEPSASATSHWMSMFDVAGVGSRLSDLETFQTNINNRIDSRLSFKLGVEGKLQVYINEELYGTVAFVDKQ